MSDSPFIKQLNFPVTNLAAARKILSSLLGVEPYMDAPYYVGFRVGDMEIGLDPNGHKQGQTGPLAYFQVEDIGASLKALKDAGAQVHQEPHDVGGGKLVAVLKDSDGNLIGLLQEP